MIQPRRHRTQPTAAPLKDPPRSAPLLGTWRAGQGIDSELPGVVLFKATAGRSIAGAGPHHRPQPPNYPSLPNNPDSAAGHVCVSSRATCMHDPTCPALGRLRELDRSKSRRGRRSDTEWDRQALIVAARVTIVGLRPYLAVAVVFLDRIGTALGPMKSRKNCICLQ